MRPFLLALLLLGGCTSVSQPGALAPLQPLYELPQMSLEEKAEQHFQAIVTNHLNDEGYLLYNVRIPLHSSPINYQESHNSADLPTWHGHWLAALAFREATNPDPQNRELIKRGLQALLINFEATGIEGLLARAWMRHPSSERDLSFLQKYNPIDYPTKHWRQGKNGYWFRTGIAKGHYNGVVLGLAASISLQRRELIHLDAETQALLTRLATSLAYYLIDNDYRIVGFDGRTTEFGNLGDFYYNGNSVVLLTALLRTCAAVDPTDKCSDAYLGFLTDEMPGQAMYLYGRAIREIFGKRLGGSIDDLYNANDIHHVATATLAHLLVADNENYVDEVQLYRNLDLMEALATVAGRERNTFFNFSYLLQRIALSSPLTEQFQYLDQLRLEGRETLRLFPTEKIQIVCQEVPTIFVQPIANMRINSHYWKTNWYIRCDLPAPGQREKTGVEYSGQDYLFPYYLGKFFRLLEDDHPAFPNQGDPQ